MKGAHWTPEEEASLARLAKKHKASEISEILGRPYHGIKAKANRLGVNLFAIGENHHLAKHSDSIVEKCRELNDQGLSSRQIAKITGIGDGTIHKWISFETRTGIHLRS
jgi:DNA invertase Pin-like site-specific DNA recombinase